MPAVSAEGNHDVDLRFSFDEGHDNVQPGCITLHRELNPCHQIATSMNGLDTPKIDVLILVPASPFAERDMRILRQSTEMWADGIDWMAEDIGLQWLADGVEFHIFMEMINTGESEFTTYPIVDPEIVVIATNPVGGIGIGVDPIDFAGLIFGEGIGEGPCHGVKNPFDMSLWENLPGFDSHHNGRSGTYVEDCDGAGGNICFSVNGAIDPETSIIDIFQLYDLASHETGHCLTLGHVGDGAEGDWSTVPTNDIMAYHSDPPGLSKCVSSLNVEALAVEMSRYLDTNGDGAVTAADRYFANDAEGEFDDRPFQIQHTDNHYYASPDREALTCPQPDMTMVPLSERVNFTPDAPVRPTIAITSVSDGHSVAQGKVEIAGYVNGASGTVNVSYIPQAMFLNETMEYEPLVEYEAVIAANGTWIAVIELGWFSDATQILVSATWIDEGQILDSDRSLVVVDEDVPSYEALLDERNPDESKDVPGMAAIGLLAALGVAFAARRK